MSNSLALVIAVTCGALSGCSSQGGDDDRTVIEPPHVSCPSKPPAPGSDCSPLSPYDMWNSCTYSGCNVICTQQRKWSNACGDAAADSASPTDASEEASTDALEDATADALEDATFDADAAD